MWDELDVLSGLSMWGVEEYVCVRGEVGGGEGGFVGWARRSEEHKYELK